MSTPTAKRRKLDATAALARPFKSPLRSPGKTAGQDLDKQTSKLLSNGPEKLGLCSTLTTDMVPSPGKSTCASHSRVTHTRFSSLPSSIRTDPKFVSLQRQHASLWTQFRALQADLDTLNQARKIEQSDRNQELEKLIALWRSVSHQAAEEMFVDARDRVNRMGGVGAWKERERKGRESWGSAGEQHEVLATNEELLEEEYAAENKRRDGTRRVTGNADGGGQKVENMVDDNDEGFSMDMMLGSLHIELDIIGYDREMQRWIE